MSAIMLRCPDCGISVKYSGPRILGKRAKCPDCGTVFNLPKSACDEVGREDDAGAEPDYQPNRRKRPRSGKRQKPSNAVLLGALVGGAVVLVVVVGAVLVYLGVKTTQLDVNTAWRDFTPPGENFVVAFPGTPGQKDPTTYELSFRMQRITFGVSFKDVPPMNPVQQDIAFNGARDAIVHAIAGGTLLSDKRVSFGPYPGREWEVRGAANRYAFARAYAVNQRFYILAVDGPQDESLTAFARKFADSFKLPGVNQPAAGTGQMPAAGAQGPAAPGATAPPGAEDEGQAPSIVLSNVRINRDGFFPKVALDYQFERGAPNSDMLFHLVVTPASGKSYEQLLAISESKAKLNQDMLELPKTERGPFKVHMEMVRIKPNAKAVKVSNVVSVSS